MSADRKKSYSLTRYSCGHAGMETGVKEKAFIRWAELRHHKIVDEPGKKCPGCKAGGR